MGRLEHRGNRAGFTHLEAHSLPRGEQTGDIKVGESLKIVWVT